MVIYQVYIEAECDFWTKLLTKAFSVSFAVRTDYLLRQASRDVALLVQEVQFGDAI